MDGLFDFGFVHVKAVDDCGHDRLWRLRVRYLEVMDGLVAQIVRLLHEAEMVRSPSASPPPSAMCRRDSTPVVACSSAWACQKCSSCLCQARRVAQFEVCHQCIHRCISVWLCLAGALIPLTFW